MSLASEGDKFKKKRGTVAAFEDKSRKQYTFMLEVLKYYSEPNNIPEVKSNNRVYELSSVCAKAYEVLKDHMADDLIKLKYKLK